LAAIRAVLEPEGVLLRNDAAVRRHEALPLEVEAVFGAVPDEVEVAEDGVRYLAAPRSGQKTGAFLDQRENRRLAAEHTHSGGRALDVFTYHGSFALHLAGRAASVLAVDQSADALARGARNAALNGLTNVRWREPTPSICCASWTRRASGSTRSCSTHRRSPSPATACRGRSPGTRR
jgi:23S rRNA (cytosine1962-C5)-methyltransferase